MMTAFPCRAGGMREASSRTRSSAAAKAFKFKAEYIFDERLERCRTIWSAGIKIGHTDDLER